VTTSPPADGERSLTRDVLRLAVPAMASGFVSMGYHWVNQFWVGRLGTESTAGLSVATFAVWAYLALTGLVSVGLSALVGRYAGAGRPDAARYVAAQGYRLALLLSVVVAAAGWLLAPAVFRVAGLSGGAAATGTDYVRIGYLGGAATMALFAGEAVFRGNGSTLLPFLVSLAGLALNVVLDPLLIFGSASAAFEALASSSPETPGGLGVPGAALATLLSNAASAALGFALLRRRGLVGGPRPPDERLRLHASTPLSPRRVLGLDLSVARRVMRVGLPVTASGLVFVAIYLGVSSVVTGAGGNEAQAALGVGLRGEMVAYVVGTGFSAAAAVLVSRRLGAGLPRDAARGAWTAVRLASVACLAWACALWLFADPLSRLFLDRRDAVALDHARSYYRIVAFCLVPQCWEVVLEGAFSGAGLTVPPMVVSVVLTATRIPLAHLVSPSVDGIWTVIAATAALRGVFLAVWFARGTWKTRTV
jgi:putative MATE family efflux protein